MKATKADKVDHSPKQNERTRYQVSDTQISQGSYKNEKPRKSRFKVFDNLFKRNKPKERAEQIQLADLDENDMAFRLCPLDDDAVIKKSKKEDNQV